MSASSPSQPSRLPLWCRGLGSTSGLAFSIHGLVLFLGAALLVRVLSDDLSSPDSRYSGSLNLSGGIAVLFVLVAVGLLSRRRHGVLPVVVAVLWLCRCGRTIAALSPAVPRPRRSVRACARDRLSHWP